MDLSGVSVSQSVRLFVYILSGVVAVNNYHAGDLFLFCSQKGDIKIIKLDTKTSHTKDGNLPIIFLMSGK